MFSCSCEIASFVHCLTIYRHHFLGIPVQSMLKVTDLLVNVTLTSKGKFYLPKINFLIKIVARRKWSFDIRSVDSQVWNPLEAWMLCCVILRFWRLWLAIQGVLLVWLESWIAFPKQLIYNSCTMSWLNRGWTEVREQKGHTFRLFKLKITSNIIRITWKGYVARMLEMRIDSDRFTYAIKTTKSLRSV